MLRPASPASTGPARPSGRPLGQRRHRTRRLLGVAALAAVLAVSMTACGGDDGGGDATATTATTAPGAPRPSKDEFVAAANGLCDQFNQQMATIGDQLGDDASLDDLVAAYRDKALPAFRATVTGIRALGFPAEDDTALRTLFDDVDAAIDRVQKDPEKELQASNDPFESVNQRLEDYGLDRCAP